MSSNSIGKVGKRRRPSSRCSQHKSSASARGKDFRPVMQDADSFRLQKMLINFPEPFSSLEVVKAIGEGTFSTVFLAKNNSGHIPDANQDQTCGKWRCRYALKYLVPTSSPERILMEVDCLRIAGGKANVLPLLFVHRSLGDVVLAMPYIESSKFSEVVSTMDFVEMKLYMKNLLISLAHIHSLGIIHRDIKPANFLYDRRRMRFALIDFGLAQRNYSELKEVPFSAPVCKRKLTSSDLANSMESPPPSKTRRRKRSSSSCQKRIRKTPIKRVEPELISQFYDRRGSLLSQRRLKSRLASRVSSDDDQEQEATEAPAASTTPSKGKIVQMVSMSEEPQVRRSPRKHTGSVTYSKLTITGSAIVPAKASAGFQHKLVRHNSFTILDPTSGIPSDLETPRLQASLTSRHSLLTQNQGPSTSGLKNDSNFLNKNPKSYANLGRLNTPSLIDLARCDCYGKPKLCAKCLGRRSQKAARAGTPGFRPPEVLLKCEHQTTAVDMWAAGVVMLCIMSRTYPFFRAPDDITALAELVVVFGINSITQAASQYDKNFICSEQVKPQDLAELCEQLAKRGDQGASQSLVSVESLDLLQKLLCIFANERITAEHALLHPLFTD